MNSVTECFRYVSNNIRLKKKINVRENSTTNKRECTMLMLKTREKTKSNLEIVIIQ
jgi:hypothetical protein